MGKLPFAQTNAHIVSANVKRLKWQIFGPSAHWDKNQNLRKPTNYIPLDPESYTDHYSQKDYALKSNCNKDMSRIRLSRRKFLNFIIFIITICRYNFKTIMTIFYLTDLSLLLLFQHCVVLNAINHV